MIHIAHGIVFQLAEKAGFPKGVFNVVTCDRGNVPTVGKVLCESPLVSLISFTGSSAVGKVRGQNNLDENSMSRHVRKSVFRVSDHVRHKPVCTATE